jgi:chromosome segregation ATPase
MTEQELLQENEKLNGRLQKAITVFGEQKATITRLTEERDSANADIEKLKNRIAELEAKANEASENDAKFFEQLNEIQVLEGRVNKLKNDCEDAYDKIAQKDSEINALKDEATAFQAQVETTAKMLADAEALNDQKLKALNDIIEENKTALEESQKQNETLNERLANAATKFKDQETAIAVLQNNVNELAEKNKEAEIDYASKVEELNAVREAYEKSQNMLADTQSKMDARVAELQATIVEKDKTINDLQNKNAATQTQIGEVKTKIQEINRLGSDLMSDFNMFA